MFEKTLIIVRKSDWMLQTIDDLTKKQRNCDFEFQKFVDNNDVEVNITIWLNQCDFCK